MPAPGALQSPQPSSQSLGWPWPHVSLSHGHTHGVLERTSVRLAGKARRFIHGVTALGQPVGMVYSLVVLLKKGLRHCPAFLFRSERGVLWGLCGSLWGLCGYVSDPGCSGRQCTMCARTFILYPCVPPWPWRPVSLGVQAPPLKRKV